MARVATEADFHGTRMNNPNCLYDEYRRYPFFAQRATVIRQRFPNVATVLVAGCAKGYLVDELRRLGTVAHGCDVSQWAVGAAAQAIPTNAQFIRRGDCTIASEMAAIRSASLGGPASRRFALCVTEDLLTVLTDAEVTAALAALRGISTAMFHIVTAGSATDPTRTAALNWKTRQQWKALVGTDLVLDAEQGTIA